MYQRIVAYLIISQHDQLSVHNMLSQHRCDTDRFYPIWHSFKKPRNASKAGKRKRHQIWWNSTCCCMRHTHMLPMSLTRVCKSLCIAFMLNKGQICELKIVPWQLAYIMLDCIFVISEKYIWATVWNGTNITNKFNVVLVDIIQPLTIWT